jgi:hypothetical protein
MPALPDIRHAACTETIRPASRLIGTRRRSLATLPTPREKPLISQARTPDEFLRQSALLLAAIIKAVVARSTKASAKLENREVATDYVCPASVARFLAERQSRWPMTPLGKQTE